MATFREPETTSAPRQGVAGHQGAGLEGAAESGRGTVREAGATAERMVTSRQQALAAEVSVIRRAFRGAARALDDEGRGSWSRYLDEIADRTDALGRRLQDRGARELLSDAEDWARRQPLALFGGALLAGLALSRFIKSSAERRGHPIADDEGGL